MKPTMKDVAELAGVGVGTVSRVINGNPSVKPTTLKKVQDAIKELNYTPNEYARGMKTEFTNTIALIIPTVWHPFFGEFVFHAESKLSNLGYKVYICNSHGSAKKELEYITMVEQNRVDGIIGITYSDIDHYVDSNLPFVSIDRHFTEDVSYVTSNNSKVGILAFEELYKGGSRHMAFIGSHQETPNETKKRMRSFIEQCDINDVDYKVLNMLEPIDNVKDKIYKFLKNHKEIDGIFAINDFLALDVLEVLKKLNRNVPEEVQVVGCDGIKMAGERDYLLSTVRQPVDKMASESVDLLLSILNKEEIDRRVVLDVEFIKGNTTR